MSITAIDRVGLAGLEGPPTNSNQPSLGTTPVLIASPTDASGRPRWRTVLITNLSTTARVAFTTVAKGAAAPSLTADANATTGGSIVLPNSQLQVPVQPGLDIYVVADNAATPTSVQQWLLS